MNVFAHVEGLIRSSLSAMQADGALPADIDISGIEAETPRDKTHGDFATNAAMVLAKKAGMKPRDIADELKVRMERFADIEKADVAGPGFLNLQFKPEFWQAMVGTILEAGELYGQVDLGHGTKTNVEYVSANPTGPMHVGHCRGAVFGDALARLLEFAGYDVSREYYINDAGGQVDMLARSAFLRYREALGEDIGEIPEGLYPGDYLVPVGEALAAEFGDKLKERDEVDWMPVVRAKAIELMMVMIREDLAALNIHLDVFFSEASLQSNGRDRIKEAIDALKAKGLIYEGVLPRPKGHDDEEWEEREQILFRSTEFGDDVDRAIAKSDGSHTYFAGDIGYHYDKLQRGFTHLINVFGADHIGYIKRMKSAVAALSDGKAEFDIKVCQLVKLFRGGEPVRMSKRAGTFVTLRDVVEEVGRDPVRFMMIYRKNDAPLDFDFAKVTEQSKDNPVFYVQYAHARAASVLRNAQEAFAELDTASDALRRADLSKLTDPGEIELIKMIASFPRLIEGAARAHEPHRLAFYLYEVANALHSQWARGNDSPHLRFIAQGDVGMTAARLAMIAATQQVISSGLGVLGVEAPDAMR
ncbi:MAG: arginine--tRNA ligase [Alphaproteobacteria bacterium]|nr:arginine--tRNA ligase [Alphaproteobacteria bacterium]